MSAPPPSAQPTPGPVTPPASLPTLDLALARELDPTGVAKLELAMSVCAAAVKHDGKKLLVGCRACPPFTSESGPDGQVLVSTSADAFYELEAIYLGSFSRPDATEVAAVFQGCEPHAGNWGGTLLAERRGPVWVATSYRSGFHPIECRSFRLLDGHDLLVCRWETDHQSYVDWRLDSLLGSVPEAVRKRERRPGPAHTPEAQEDGSQLELGRKHLPARHRVTCPAAGAPARQLAAPL